MLDWRDLRVEYGPDGVTPVSGEIVFSHVDSGEGVMRHFLVERIERDLRNGTLTPEIIEFELDPNFALYANVHRGVEPHRLARITPADLCHYPVVMAYFPEIGKDIPEHLLIDGHHRYVKAWSLGWKTLRAYVLPREVWEERYLVHIPEWMIEGKKDELLNQHNVPIDSRIK